MEGRCAKHQFEAAEDTCRSCGNEFCGECLVYSFGPKKPPYCIACALTAAGVRTTAANLPTKSKKDLKHEARERRKAEKASIRNRTAGVDVEWSMPEDPTAGLTEEDLRLPTAPVDAPPPPPPPPPPPLGQEDPADAELPAGVVVPAPNPEPDAPSEVAPATTSPATTSPTEPPQFLLRQGPVPDLPGNDLPAPAPLLVPTDTGPPRPAPPSALGLEDLVGLAPAAPAAPPVDPLRTGPPPPVVPPPVLGPGAADVPAPESVTTAAAGQEPPQFLLRQAAPPTRPTDEVPLPLPGATGEDLFGIGAVIAAPAPPPPAGPPAPAPPAAATPALGEFGPGEQEVEAVLGPPPAGIETGREAAGSAASSASVDEPFVAKADEPEAFAPLPFERTMFGTAGTESSPVEPAAFEPTSFEPAAFEPGAVLGLAASAPAERPTTDPASPEADPEPPAVDADHLFAPGTEAPAPGHAPFDASSFDAAVLAAPSVDPAPFERGAGGGVDRPHDPAPPDGGPPPWDLSGKPLRVRDLLDDPDRPAPLGPRPTDTSGFTPRAVPGDEPAFFAPVTPEQLGDDLGPPAPPS